MKRTIQSVFWFVIAGVAFAPLLAGAQPEDIEGVIRVLENVLRDVSKIFWILAVGFILYAGFLFFTGADNPEQVKKARAQLLYTVIAIVVALLATALPALIKSILTV